ncbi:MAG: hypothetical protein ACLU5I_01640 [Alistipes finegoldii]
MPTSSSSTSTSEKYRAWTLPALAAAADRQCRATQYHNPRKLFHISIRDQNGWLVVSNPRCQLEPEPSTGIGLENLRNRWHLITGRDIEIIDTDKEFVVRMPLHTPLQDESTDHRGRNRRRTEPESHSETGGSRTSVSSIRSKVEESVDWLRANPCSPTCCSWTSIWPTAIRSIFDAVEVTAR